MLSGSTLWYVKRAWIARSSPIAPSVDEVVGALPQRMLAVHERLHQQHSGVAAALDHRPSPRRRRARAASRRARAARRRRRAASTRRGGGWAAGCTPPRRRGRRARRRTSRGCGRSRARPAVVGGPVGIARADRDDLALGRALHRRDHLVDGDRGAPEHTQPHSFRHGSSLRDAYPIVFVERAASPSPPPRRRRRGSPGDTSARSAARPAGGLGVVVERHVDGLEGDADHGVDVGEQRVLGGVDDDAWKSSSAVRRATGSARRRLRRGARWPRSRRAGRWCGGWRPAGPPSPRSSSGPRAARAGRSRGPSCRRTARRRRRRRGGATPDAAGPVCRSSGAPRAVPSPGAP